jgi:microcystin-dependent protein
MGQPFVGEIRMFGGNFAPAGWALCDGSVMPISGNETLFTLIGTTYGGDGQSTFALPDLRSRVPIHVGAGFVLGQHGGAETVTLTATQMPIHSHPVNASSKGALSRDPAGNLWAAWNSNQFSDQTSGLVPMNAGTITNSGGSQPHTNLGPFTTVTFIISLFGIFPSQT